jgi:hypothetical protein
MPELTPSGDFRPFIEELKKFSETSKFPFLGRLTNAFIGACQTMDQQSALISELQQECEIMHAALEQCAAIPPAACMERYWPAIRQAQAALGDKSHA